MLIILPTFKRIETVYWVIISIINNDLPALDEKPRLLIVNNYPPNKEAIENLVDSIQKKYPEKAALWEWIQLHRKETLTPVANWYSALEEFAKQDEVAFFVGDDDPLPKWSIKVRYEQLVLNKADFVSGWLCSGIFFYQNGTKLHFEGETPQLSKHTKTEIIDYSNVWGWPTVHLSNHCFVYNDTFKKSLAMVYDWFESQPEIGDFNRTLFITFYVPLALLVNNAKLIGVEEIVVYRGQSVEEIIESKFGIRSWNLGFISMLCYDVMQTFLPNEKGLIGVKNHFIETYKRWYLTTFFDPRISPAENKYIQTKYKSIIQELTLSDRLYAIKLILKDWLKIKGLPLKIKALMSAQPADKVFKKLLQID